jgi:hypothetical protein
MTTRTSTFPLHLPVPMKTALEEISELPQFAPGRST